MKKKIRVLCQRWYWQNSAIYEKAGVSLHLSQRAHRAHMREFAKGQQRHWLKYRSVPSTYLYPEREPFWCEVSADILKKFGKAKSLRIHNLKECEKMVGEAVLAQERKESEERARRSKEIVNLAQRDREISCNEVIDAIRKIAGAQRRFSR